MGGIEGGPSDSITALGKTACLWVVSRASQERREMLKSSEGMRYLEITNLLVWPEHGVQM